MDDTKTEREHSVQTFGRKKTAVAVAHVKPGSGLVKVNGTPIELIKPIALRWKAVEPFMVLKCHNMKGALEEFDIRVRVKGGGKAAQVYAIRQAIAKGIVAFYQKFKEEHEKIDIKNKFLQVDRTLLVADPRRTESKKFGGPGARARYQKSYR